MKRRKDGSAIDAKQGHVLVPGRGWVELRSMIIKAYYYGIQIPQDIDSNAVIGLFSGHIGDLEWTNFTRPRMLPAGHEATIFRVSLAVRPTTETRIVDVYNALQSGDIRIGVGARWDEEDLLCEPLAFFPVVIYGEIAARKDDLLQRLALTIDIHRDAEGNFDEEQIPRLMKLLSGYGIPAAVGESQIIDGNINLRKALYGTPAFKLYVILHTITTRPLRA